MNKDEEEDNALSSIQGHLAFIIIGFRINNDARTIIEWGTLRIHAQPSILKNCSAGCTVPTKPAFCPPTSCLPDEMVPRSHPYLGSTCATFKD
jgi:hypothetical protein